jgi:thymidylate synthase ThyX
VNWYDPALLLFGIFMWLFVDWPRAIYERWRWRVEVEKEDPLIGAELVAEPRDPIKQVARGLVTNGYIVEYGRALAIRGFDEETVAMLFAMYSRSPTGLKETLARLVVDGSLELPLFQPNQLSERVRKFHEKTTVGYGHKSVADHATVHWALEGVSMIVERDFLSARLVAATAQSTRYVDYREAGYVEPVEWPADRISEYRAHCDELIQAYVEMQARATEAIRQIVPFDGSGFRSEDRWATACEKRGLDMVRDVLPASVRTNFGVSCNATALREILDKRETGADWQSLEVEMAARDARVVARSVVPTLLLEDPRTVPRQPKVAAKWFAAPRSSRTLRQTVVSVMRTPDWALVQDVVGESAPDLIDRWSHDRGHHMPPDRSAEAAEYVVSALIPFAIHRELGRHRMMTQFDGPLSPNLGYAGDPLLTRFDLLAACPALKAVAVLREKVLNAADFRMARWRGSGVSPVAIQYACPMAALVPVRWIVNVRELVHLIGLRTTPQVHPIARRVVQDVAKAISEADPMISPLVDEVTNFDQVIVGRPG